MATFCSCGNDEMKDYDNYDPDENFCKAQRPGKMALNCGCGAVGPLPILALGITNPYSVASATLDTRGMKNSTILLRVTTSISYPVAALPSLTFRIVKTCDDGSKQTVGGSFTSTSAVNLLTGKSFEFQICDCNNCCGCCTYTLEIANATILAPGVTVSGQISAMAVEKAC